MIVKYALKLIEMTNSPGLSPDPVYLQKIAGLHVLIICFTTLNSTSSFTTLNSTSSYPTLSVDNKNMTTSQKNWGSR